MEDESVAVISSVMGKMGEQGGEVWIDRGGPEEPIRGIKGLTKKILHFVQNDRLRNEGGGSVLWSLSV